MLVEYFKKMVTENDSVENIAAALVKTDVYALSSDNVKMINCYEFFRYIAKRYDYPDNEKLDRAISRIAPDGIAIFNQFESVLIMEFFDIYEPENKQYACYAA